MSIRLNRVPAMPLPVTPVLSPPAITTSAVKTNPLPESPVLSSRLTETARHITRDRPQVSSRTTKPAISRSRAPQIRHSQLKVADRLTMSTQLPCIIYPAMLLPAPESPDDAAASIGIHQARQANNPAASVSIISFLAIGNRYQTTPPRIHTDVRLKAGLSTSRYEYRFHPAPRPYTFTIAANPRQRTPAKRRRELAYQSGAPAVRQTHSEILPDLRYPRAEIWVIPRIAQHRFNGASSR